MSDVERDDHDRWFKELITTFFEEFILAFFPDIYEHLDFQHITFLQQSVYTDILKGKKGTVDILAETKLKGEDTLILVHIEPQSTYEKDFNDRMYFYFNRLYEEHRRPIVPIAIFSYDKIKKESDSFNIHFPFKEVLTFNYLTLQLYNKNWRDYITHPNPVALALLGKMGYNKSEKVRIKFEFLRLLIKLELDPARQSLVAGIFEKYHILNIEEEHELKEQLNKIPKDEVSQIMELMTSWEKKGLEKGIEKGRQEGRQEGKLEGIHEGKQEEKRKTAKKLLKMGLSLSEVAETTELAIKEVEQINRELTL